MKYKKQSYAQAALMVLLMSVIGGAFFLATSLPEFKSHAFRELGSQTMASTKTNLVDQDIAIAFAKAEAKLSKEDKDIIESITRANASEEQVAYGENARETYRKVENIYLYLKPHADQVLKEIDEVEAQLKESTFVIPVKEHGRPGEHRIALVEGLLGEYGAHGIHNNILVSEDRDEFGWLPLNMGVSPAEVAKIRDEFKKLKASSHYNKQTELAHASFLRNWYKVCHQFDSGPDCHQPDKKEVESVDKWYQQLRREVAMLRAKRRALAALERTAFEIQQARKKLAEHISTS